MSATKSEGFGVYLKGSVARQTNLSWSDVDLIVLIDPRLPARRVIGIKTLIYRSFPKWQDAELDLQFIIADQARPPLAADIISLAFLQQHGELILGMDLRSQCFPVVWEDYCYCLHRTAEKYLKTFPSLDGAYFYQECLRRKKLKFIYSVALSIALYLQIKGQPQSWVFAPEAVTHPVFQTIFKQFRQHYAYTLPSDPTELSQIEKTCAQFADLCQEFQVSNR